MLNINLTSAARRIYRATAALPVIKDKGFKPRSLANWAINQVLGFQTRLQRLEYLRGEGVALLEDEGRLLKAARELRLKLPYLRGGDGIREALIQAVIDVIEFKPAIAQNAAASIVRCFELMEGRYDGEILTPLVLTATLHTWLTDYLADHLNRKPEGIQHIWKVVFTIVRGQIDPRQLFSNRSVIRVLYLRCTGQVL